MLTGRSDGASGDGARSQGAGATMVVALAAILPLQLRAPAPVTPAPVTPSPRASTIDVVRTSPEALDRLAIAPAASSIEKIDDGELLEILRAAGQDAGLIRTQGRVVVLGAEVTRVGDDAGSAG